MIPKELEVSPEQRRQVTITLSEKAWEEYNLIADWKRIPLATLLRNKLEEHHETPSFSSTVKRARADVRSRRKLEDLGLTSDQIDAVMQVFAGD